MLSFSDKLAIRLRTGWSDRVLSSIGSREEAEIYIRAGLREAVVGGRPALIRSDIDWSAFNCRKDWLKSRLADWDRWRDYNNADLIGEGYPPRDSNGDPYELHHIGQRQDSPFAELTWAEHMGDGNNTSCTRPARSRRSTAVSSMMRNPPTGRRGLGAFRNRSLTEYIQRNKCRVARSAPTGDEFFHIRCLRVPPCALGQRFCPFSLPVSAGWHP